MAGWGIRVMAGSFRVGGHSRAPLLGPLPGRTAVPPYRSLCAENEMILGAV